MNAVPKKHKKHRLEKRERHESSGERPSGLKLILKVGGQGTPEHNSDLANVSGYTMPEVESLDPNDPYYAMTKSHHKKSKKKKKKKDKCKDREKKHKHKKRKREESETENTGNYLE